MKPRLPGAQTGYVLRQDPVALAAEVARLRAALTEIASWTCDNRQLVALSALGWLENA